MVAIPELPDCSVPDVVLVSVTAVTPWATRSLVCDTAVMFTGPEISIPVMLDDVAEVSPAAPAVVNDAVMPRPELLMALISPLTVSVEGVMIAVPVVPPEFSY